ncbi:hypothetical protein MKZ38_002207 [Zalerion maritima]|uniref:Uncharacterized protein n=1 Tax=Zalerion maritima TaxID=339359 RepID=A0AAD5RPZ5_9PEZI|nr:hypothetical protein MKZ38_002207 [Zalerion maritima]
METVVDTRLKQLREESWSQHHNSDGGTPLSKGLKQKCPEELMALTVQVPPVEPLTPFRQGYPRELQTEKPLARETAFTIEGHVLERKLKSPPKEHLGVVASN